VAVLWEGPVPPQVAVEGQFSRPPPTYRALTAYLARLMRQAEAVRQRTNGREERVRLRAREVLSGVFCAAGGRSAWTYYGASPRFRA
jgi:hypothetical protein